MCRQPGVNAIMAKIARLLPRIQFIGTPIRNRQSLDASLQNSPQFGAQSVESITHVQVVFRSIVARW
ncbi:hypothetical protein CIW54_22960 [Paraburkholderia sp. T12-10]|nr:hypothetical protein CIW54_22960 [Paraburkholderia sp. T12-10]